MTIIDCCISLKMIKKFLVVLGVVDMRQLLLKGFLAFMQHFKFVNWWICGFVSWCHEQVTGCYDLKQQPKEPKCNQIWDGEDCENVTRMWPHLSVGGSNARLIPGSVRRDFRPCHLAPVAPEIFLTCSTIIGVLLFEMQFYGLSSVLCLNVVQ